MQPDPKVLVVGTTADYIQWIRLSCPGTGLFLTDPSIRRSAGEPPPQPGEEVLCELSDYARVQQALERHLDQYGQRLAGVACFDCESLELAAVTALRFALPFPSPEAVANCRNKYLAKRLWQARHLHTPALRLVRSAHEAIRFQELMHGPIVLKPLSGSGSELIFACTDAEACSTNYDRIRTGLIQRRNQRLYADYCPENPEILAEAMIDGDEYSCDFVVRNGRAQVIRLTRKIISSRKSFGTARGYLLSGMPPEGLDAELFCQTLFQSADALGIRQAVCMLDFFISRGRMELLELAPRPGGDCLPFLLRQAWNLDILKLVLDLARNQPLQIQASADGEPMVGLRVHARQGGILQHIDSSALKGDSRVREICLTRRPGHPITLPPNDYESWLLGHVIFKPDRRTAIEDQCADLLDHIEISVGPQKDHQDHVIPSGA